jgi:phosphohistidine phosphatase SixA
MRLLSSGLLASPAKRASEFLPQVKGALLQSANTVLPQQMDQRPEQHLLHVLDTHLRFHARSHWSKIHLVGHQPSTKCDCSTVANTIRYWGSIGQGIAMFLAGGMSRAGLNARAAGDIATANQYGAAAASFVYIFTFVFGATWLTVPW